ncbi:MAG TPA: hypothetical protein PLO37_07975 [Candidatus Hydrogenedentes bacterium]|nr:hypothetical protein [Candidatus Hydrogenedentota bacterium]HPG66768.1 hypothetical protein [Candidatus Hydrogenedentota bacterium]
MFSRFGVALWFGLLLVAACLLPVWAQEPPREAPPREPEMNREPRELPPRGPEMDRELRERGPDMERIPREIVPRDPDMRIEPRPEGERGELRRAQEEARHVLNDDMRAFLREELPEAMELLERKTAESERPGAPIESKFEVCEMARHLARTVEELRDAREHRPEAFMKMKEFKQLELQSMLLAEEYHRQPEAEAREQLQQKIREVLDRGFVVSQELRELEAKAIQGELDEISNLLERRRENRELIIDRRMQQLLHGTDPYEW